MLSIITHLRNTNQNLNELTVKHLRCLKFKRLTTPSISRDMKQLDFSYIADEKIKQCNCLGKTVGWFLIKLKIKVYKTYNPI